MYLASIQQPPSALFYRKHVERPLLQPGGSRCRTSAPFHWGASVHYRSYSRPECGRRTWSNESSYPPRSWKLHKGISDGKNRSLLTVIIIDFMPGHNHLSHHWSYAEHDHILHHWLYVGHNHLSHHWFYAEHNHLIFLWTLISFIESVHFYLFFWWLLDKS